MTWCQAVEPDQATSEGTVPAEGPGKGDEDWLD